MLDICQKWELKPPGLKCSGISFYCISNSIVCPHISVYVTMYGIMAAWSTTCGYAFRYRSSDSRRLKIVTQNEKQGQLYCNLIFVLVYGKYVLVYLNIDWRWIRPIHWPLFSIGEEYKKRPMYWSSDESGHYWSQSARKTNQSIPYANAYCILSIKCHS